MSEQYVPNLGGTPSENARRDAMHICVAPVVAGHRLLPGQRVVLDPVSREGFPAFREFEDKGEVVGVVDPFVKDCVLRGERFWLLLYPGTITGLRHLWSHPAFAPKTSNDEGVRRGVR